VGFNAGLPAGIVWPTSCFRAVERSRILSSSTRLLQPSDASSGNTGYSEFDGTGIDLTIQNSYCRCHSLRPTLRCTCGITDRDLYRNTIIGPMSISNLPSNQLERQHLFTTPHALRIGPRKSIINSNPTGVKTLVLPNNRARQGQYHRDELGQESHGECRHQQSL